MKAKIIKIISIIFYLNLPPAYAWIYHFILPPGILFILGYENLNLASSLIWGLGSVVFFFLLLLIIKKWQKK